ncbi:regulator of sigma E protease [Alteromonadaceae bacterium Bs31]|nr:regulator of sigma E protease [Alteromonadaceae bacterium Bs31]
MIETLTTIFYFLIAITILVAVHEFGHYYAARRCGVRVLRFSIGFGTRLLKWTDRHGTEFAISSVPLGGYVKMLDEREGEVAPEDRPYAFTSKPVWQRIVIAFAGPLANFILAILLYWLLAVLQGSVSVAPVIGSVEPDSIAAEAGLEAGQEIKAVDGSPINSRRALEIYLLNRLGESGEISFTVKYPDSDLVYESKAKLDKWLRGAEGPDVISGLGLSFYSPPLLSRISQVMPDMPAAAAGLQVGDEIVEVDGQNSLSVEKLTEYISARAGQELEIIIERETEEGLFRDTKLITPKEVEADNGTRGVIGIAWSREQFPQEMVRYHRYGFVSGMNQAVSSTFEVIDTTFLSIKKLVVGEISTKNLSGPIGIAKVAGDSAKAGIWYFINFLAYISVLLGVFNLLPVPVLDGGHILFGLIEWVKGSPVSEKIQMLGYQAGLAMLLGLMVIAFYNDILRLS